MAHQTCIPKPDVDGIIISDITTLGADVDQEATARLVEWLKLLSKNGSKRLCFLLLLELTIKRRQQNVCSRSLAHSL